MGLSDRERPDRYRAMTTGAVLVVAAIAAVISYEHVVALALRYGQPVLAAYLLPVSIDGLVAVSSLVMLRSARIGASSPWLARTGLVLAVAATLACNVGYGVAHGWPGALLSGWPAVAFVMAAETAISMTRRGPVGEESGHQADAARLPAGAGVRAESLPPPPRQTRKPQSTKDGSGQRMSAADREAAVMAVELAEPGLSHAEIARRMGVHEATIRRVRKRLAPVTSHD